MGILNRWREFRARSAPTDLYGPPRTFVMPRLDVARERHPESITQQAQSNPFVYGPMYQIAVRMGSLPIKVYELTDEPGRPGRREASEHPSYELLRHPNPDITRAYLVSGTVLSMLATSHAAWVKVRTAPDAPPSELWPIPGENFVPISTSRRLFTGISIKLMGAAPLDIPASEVCYFRLVPSFLDFSTPSSPYSTLQLAGEMGYEAMDIATDLYDTGLVERRYISATEPMDDDSFNRLAAQIEQARGDRGKMPFLEEGVEIKPMGDGPDDEQMLRAMDRSQKLIYDTLGIPMERDDKAFFTNAIGPIADAIEQELERSYFSEWPQRLFGEFAFRDVLKGSPAERAAYHQTLIQSGQETINEARSDWDREPIDGGERTFIPLNLMDVSEEITGKPRETDTAGGLGGAEEGGRGTLPRVSKPMAGRASASRRRRKWGQIRERIIDAHRTALERRLRSIVRREQTALRAVLEVPARAGAQAGLPSIDELIQIIATHDQKTAALLQAAMSEMSQEVWNEAQSLIGAAHTEVASVIEQAIAEKVAVMVERFNVLRTAKLTEWFEQTVAGSMTVREMAEEISSVWGQEISKTVANAIAADGTGYAFEQAALYSWASEGITSFDVVYGGGPCTTGVCEEVAANGPYISGESLDSVGFSFLGTTTPPLHPSCGCYTVAAVGPDTMAPAGQGV